MTGSILTDTKKALNISEGDTSFDSEIIMYINSAFSTLQQIGVGPTLGYMIEGKDEIWSDFIDDSSDQSNSYNLVKSYIYLKTRLIFDPPSTSFHIKAIEDQITEHETRLSNNREWWLDPVDPKTVEEEVDDDS